MSTITIEKSSGNVYADLGMADAQEMLVKAKLASKIGDIIKRQNLTQQQAAELLAMPQPKVSLLLRGQFRGISEAKMLECLARLGARHRHRGQACPQGSGGWDGRPGERALWLIDMACERCRSLMIESQGSTECYKNNSCSRPFYLG